MPRTVTCITLGMYVVCTSLCTTVVDKKSSDIVLPAIDGHVDVLCRA